MIVYMLFSTPTGSNYGCSTYLSSLELLPRFFLETAHTVFVSQTPVKRAVWPLPEVEGWVKSRTDLFKEDGFKPLGHIISDLEKLGVDCRSFYNHYGVYPDGTIFLRTTSQEPV